MPIKTYQQFIKDTNNKGLSTEQIDTLTKFKNNMSNICNNALSYNPPGNSMVSLQNHLLGNTITLNMLNRFGKQEEISKKSAEEIANDDNTFRERANHINNVFADLASPDLMPHFIKGVLGGKKPIENGEKLLLDTIAILNVMYGMNIDINAFQKAIDKEKKIEQPQIDENGLTPADKAVLKVEQDSFSAQLDGVSAGLSAKHRTGLGFGVGTTSDELQATKDALADYKAYLADPKNPKFEGKSELDMLTALKGAADNYMTIKRQNGKGDTSSPDWLPKTNMGQERFKANKNISELAGKRIAELQEKAKALQEKQAAENMTVSEKINDISKNIDENSINIVNPDEQKRARERYVRNATADMLAWKALEKKHGKEPFKNFEQLHAQEKEKIMGTKAFEALQNNLKDLSAKEREHILKKPEELAGIYTRNEAFYDDITAKINNAPEGSISRIQYELSENYHMSNVYSYGDIKRCIALEMYKQEAGANTKFNNSELEKTYLPLVDEQIVKTMMNGKTQKALEAYLSDPSELLYDYDQTLSKTIGNKVNDEKQNQMPGSISEYQDNIRDLINEEPPAEDFEYVKNEIMRNTARIIATRSIWPKTDTRTEEEIKIDLGKNVMGIDDVSGEGKIFGKNTKELPESIKGKKAKVNWNKMSLKEKAIAYGEDVYDGYKKDLGNKIQQREEIAQELYSERDDFQYMFDKAKTWKDVVDLSKKVLAPNTKIVMHELYRSSKELKNLKEQSANADKSIAKTNVVEKKGAVIQ